MAIEAVDNSASTFVFRAKSKSPPQKTSFKYILSTIYLRTTFAFKGTSDTLSSTSRLPKLQV